jgi:hypothetical protein
MPVTIGRALVVAVALELTTACAARRPSSTASTKATVAATAVAHVEPPTPECSADADCKAWAILPFSGRSLEYRAVPTAKVRALAADIESKIGHLQGDATDKVALCEKNQCELYDEALALRWAASLVPAIDDLVRYSERTPANAPWFKAGTHAVLYVRSDWRVERPKPITCTALDFVADDEGHLVIAIDDRDRPVTVSGCFEGLDLGSTAVRTGTSCGHRGPDPDDPGHLRWYTSGGGELYVESWELSSADEQGLVYNGILVHATPRCRWLSVDRPQCPEPSCRTCQIVLDEYGGRGPGKEFHKTLSRAPKPEVVSQPTCGACLPDVQESWLPRLDAIVGVPLFLEAVDEESADRFFRRKKDCEAYVRDFPASRWAQEEKK